MRHVTEAESVFYMITRRYSSVLERLVHRYHSFMKIEVSEYVDWIHCYHCLAYLANSSKALKVPPASQFYDTW